MLLIPFSWLAIIGSMFLMYFLPFKFDLLLYDVIRNFRLPSL